MTDRRPIIIFDIGGTLMDGPDRTPAGRFASVLGLKKEEKKKIVKFLFIKDAKTGDDLVQEFYKVFPDMKEDAPDGIKEIWNAQFNEGYPLDGAFESLKKAKALGYRLGIISNIWHPYYSCFEKLFTDYLDLFEVITLSHKLGIVKPDKTIYYETLKKFGRFDQENQKIINPETIWMVGDSYRCDIAPPIELGMKTIWTMRNREREIEKVRAVEEGKLEAPTIIIENISQLQNCLP